MTKNANTVANPVLIGMAAITITIDDYSDGIYNDVLVILDPEHDTPHVYTYGRLGSGVPGLVYHHRHLVLGCVSPQIVADELANQGGAPKHVFVRRSRTGGYHG